MVIISKAHDVYAPQLVKNNILQKMNERPFWFTPVDITFINSTTNTDIIIILHIRNKYFIVLLSFL